MGSAKVEECGLDKYGAKTVADHENAVCTLAVHKVVERIKRQTGQLIK